MFACRNKMNEVAIKLLSFDNINYSVINSSGKNALMSA